MIVDGKILSRWPRKSCLSTSGWGEPGEGTQHHSLSVGHSFVYQHSDKSMYQLGRVDNVPLFLWQRLLGSGWHTFSAAEQTVNSKGWGYLQSYTLSRSLAHTGASGRVINSLCFLENHFKGY